MAIIMDAAPHVLGAVITLMILAYGTFGLRVWIRHGNTWGSDDCAMTAAALPFGVLSLSCILAACNGLGVHIKHLEEPENVKYQTLGMMYFFLFEVFYCASIIPIKLSIALMLIRIAQNRKSYVYAQWGIMSLFFIADGGAVFYIIFQCSPVSYAWNTNQSGSCLPATWLADIYYTCTAVNITTDWVTAILPIPLLWNVRLARSEKLSVAAILGLGVFASLAACIRLNYTIGLTDETDYLFSVSNIVIWGYGEIAVGMFVGCLATLRPLIRRIFRLGSIPGSKPKLSGAEGPAFPSNSRKTYDQFPAQRDVEMGDMGTRSNAYKGSVTLSNDALVSTDVRASISSESNSMDQILREARKQGLRNKTIVVSRQINIARS